MSIRNPFERWEVIDINDVVGACTAAIFKSAHQKGLLGEQVQRTLSMAWLLTGLHIRGYLTLAKLSQRSSSRSDLSVI